MKISNTIDVTLKSADRAVVLTVGTNVHTVCPTDTNYNAFFAYYNALRQTSEEKREEKSKFMLDTYADLAPVKEVIEKGKTAEAEAKENRSEEDKIKDGIKNIVNFFKEFNFEPNFRFLNTLARSLQISKKNAKDYVTNYFALVDNAYQNEISEKIKSTEFNLILDDLAAKKPTHNVNSRFKIYYGSQGTGKTTLAQTETDNRCIVCNNSMLPADLMEDFTFVSGNATFNHSVLWECMEKGLPIVLDEINLLPFESLRFLQGILDNKSEFTYKGATVHINEGFQIIGTMNLTVNGATFGLPEPLVDRSAELKKFVLTTEQLMSSII